MKTTRSVLSTCLLRASVGAISVTVLAACSSSPDKPKPAELPLNMPQLGVRQAWSVKVPSVGFPLQTSVSGDALTVAGSDGTVVSIDSRTGQENWRVNVATESTARTTP